MKLLEPMARQHPRFVNTLRTMSTTDPHFWVSDELKRRWQNHQRGRSWGPPAQRRKAPAAGVDTYDDTDASDWPPAFVDKDMLPPGSGEGSTMVRTW